MSRLDQLLVESGLIESRNRAAIAIRAGHVTVNGDVIKRPAYDVPAGAQLDVAQDAYPYVSRGGLKLAAALSTFDLSPQGLVALDLGASTGGFTDVLLQAGADHVYAVDVGHGQLHPRLIKAPQVTNLEGLNARDLQAAHFSKPIQILVCDVSFISLRLVLPPALSVITAPAWLVVLIKPQFEAGPAAIGKNGVVSDPAVHASVCAAFQDWFADYAPNWRAVGLCDSPITGPQGNREFLFAACLE